MALNIRTSVAAVPDGVVGALWVSPRVFWVLSVLWVLSVFWFAGLLGSLGLLDLLGLL